MSIKIALAGTVTAAIFVMAAVSFYRSPNADRLLSCNAPSGAMNAISYEEMFIGELHDLSFSCLPMPDTACGLYLCTSFTAIDEQDKHVIGYVWRDNFNKPTAAMCSPDGGKAGTFYGECPVGSPAPTVYRCPWCAPNAEAKADMRGIAKP
jgi:hypothetical protein